MSNFLYGGNVHANGIRQHYLRYGGARGAGAIRSSSCRASPVRRSLGASWASASASPSIPHPGCARPGLVRGRRGAGLWPGRAGRRRAGVRAGAGPGAIQPGRPFHGRPHRRARRAEQAGRPAVPRPGRPAGVGPRPPALSGQAALVRRLHGAGAPGHGRRGHARVLPSWTDAQRQLRAEWLHTCDERAIIQSFDDFHNDDIHADLPLLDAAVLLITAERGDVVLDADVEEIQRLAPGTRHHRVPAAGHMIPWDNEEGFYAAFGDFLGARWRA